MKKLNLNSIILFYTLLIIGCGVTPEQESMDLTHELSGIQFLMNDASVRMNKEECLQKGAIIISLDHQGGSGTLKVAATHPSTTKGTARPLSHQGGSGTLMVDHQGGSGTKYDTFQLIELKAHVAVEVDAILVNDLTNLAFRQDREGNLQTQFCINGDDFSLTMYAGEKRMHMDLKDYQ